MRRHTRGGAAGSRAPRPRVPLYFEIPLEGHQEERVAVAASSPVFTSEQMDATSSAACPRRAPKGCILTAGITVAPVAHRASAPRPTPGRRPRPWQPSRDDTLPSERARRRRRRAPRVLGGGLPPWCPSSAAFDGTCPGPLTLRRAPVAPLRRPGVTSRRRPRQPHVDGWVRTMQEATKTRGRTAKPWKDGTLTQTSPPPRKLGRASCGPAARDGAARPPGRDRAARAALERELGYERRHLHGQAEGGGPARESGASTGASGRGAPAAAGNHDAEQGPDRREAPVSPIPGMMTPTRTCTWPRRSWPSCGIASLSARFGRRGPPAGRDTAPMEAKDAEAEGEAAAQREQSARARVKLSRKERNSQLPADARHGPLDAVRMLLYRRTKSGTFASVSPFSDTSTQICRPRLISRRLFHRPNAGPRPCARLDGARRRQDRPQPARS